MSQIDSSRQLTRGLTNRHIQLIALGGAIGTGLFLGSSSAIQIAGPVILVSYIVGGLIAFMIMRQLAEMTVEEPVAGSFSHFAYRYWSDFAGFASGWNYWLLYVLVSMAELTAAAQYIHTWFPGVPTWISVLSCFLLITFINLMAVKIYGEVEFWFAIIKVVAIVAMIIFGGYLLFFGKAGPDASVTNLWAHGGFMPHGFEGLIMSLAIVIFSFGGLELIGITASEAKNPEVTIPKATNQVIYRILIFYIGSLVVLLCLHPWNMISAKDSPFVTVFHDLDHTVVWNILNFVVLTAALSVCNSSLYCNSRMIFSLSEQGNAPKVLAQTNKRGTPVLAVLLSSIAILSAVIINYATPANAFKILMALVTSTLMINWAMISLTHIMFKRQKIKEGKKTKFPALFYPLGNIICLIFLLAIIIILALSETTRLSVELIPLWIIILSGGYLLKKQLTKA